MGIFDSLGQIGRNDTSDRLFGTSFRDTIESRDTRRVDLQRGFFDLNMGQTYELEKRDTARGHVGNDTILSRHIDDSVGLGAKRNAAPFTVSGAIGIFVGNLFK